LGDILIEQKIVTRSQIEEAIAHQTMSGKALGESLVDLRFVTEQQLTDALALQRQVETWNLLADPPTPEALELVSKTYCIDNFLVPVRVDQNTLIVAMRNPGDLGLVDQLYRMTRKNIRPVQASDAALAAYLEQFAETEGAAFDSVEGYVSKALADISADASEDRTEREVLREEETRPVIGLVNQMIADAVSLEASDIHFEPRENRVELRYRLNGRLVHIRDFPHSLMRMIVARIKIMADLDITIRRHPQDGHLEFRDNGIATDVRVSCFPTIFGSRVVMRLLDRSIPIRRLVDLGFSPLNYELFNSMIRRPHGIVLVTGPTGSGKTTTLYSAVNEIKDMATNLMTCEDPVEYCFDGVNQSQVDERSGLTFATQLRAILRQDPDVILVGEIRDAETAETALRAAMTGHLVLSTLHTNEAAGAFPRLLNMGMSPFMLSTSINGIVGQRLLRRLCDDCKAQRTPTEADLATLHALGAKGVESVWHAGGCDRCAGTGYAGRIAVHEVLPVSEHIAGLVARGECVETIKAEAAEYGYRPIGTDALSRILTGVTSLTEAQRMLTLSDFPKIGRREGWNELWQVRPEIQTGAARAA
ncbi:MAG TPA: GspE/PulE family protein, partial [Fimbriimonadaceae bacterium]|nr:GspE/PulE family protein [Fimbriimonadaceae bacterium]